MVTDNKRAWFRRYANQGNAIKRLRERVEILEDRITSIRSPNYTGLPRGGKRVTAEDLIADKVEIEERIRRLEDRARSIRREILEVIDSIGDPILSEVLEYRYIDNLDPVEISEVMGYGSRHIQRLLSQAIEEVEIPGLEDPETTGRPEDLNQVESLDP